MPLATRLVADAAPRLPVAPELEIRREHDPRAMAALQGRTEAEMAARFDAGHRAYVASWQGQPAAFGWVATRSATIGELGSTFAIPAGQRYLWNFVTLKPYRGLGIYPRLLDAIVRAESTEAERFWVAYAPENHASGAGIRKAGFTTVAELSFDINGHPAVKGLALGGADAAARVLGLPEAQGLLAQCWRCVRAGRPISASCSPDACACDYQRPEVACAA